MKNFLLLTCCLSLSLNMYSQSLEEIKSDTQTYLWGEGTGTTINRADQEALSMLISQISVFVESQTEGSATEVQQGDIFNFKESFKASVSTYSNATLDNAEQIVLSDEPNARVFRYIKRAEIDRIFAQRENKIKEFTRYGEEACKEFKVADALRYYYWALTLIRSHPKGSSITYHNLKGEEVLLATWLHQRINDVFSDVQIILDEQRKIDNYYQYLLNITYKGQPAVNFDYSYWTGRNYAGPVSAHQGLAAAEIMGETGLEQLEIKAEYIFQGEAAIDNELRDVMQRIEPIPFRNNHYKIQVRKLPAVKPDEKHQNKTKAITAFPSIEQVEDNRIFAEATEELIAAVRNKEYESVKSLFTPEGYEIFTRLMAYGNAIIIGEPELCYMQSGDNVVARTIPMQFRFSNNNRQFVEEVVVHFNGEKRIDNLTFGLDQTAIDDVLGKGVWPVEARWVLINFLENYKTAFALKRLDYIENIFADDALIIVGRVVERAPDRENPYLNNELVRYNRYSKNQYIRNLQHAFNSNEFINIRFEDNIINKAGKGGEVYGIQIKQDYFSSNYGDTGYLFLMVDVNEPDTPVIHVRTWQPHKNPDGSIYGLGDF